MTYDKRLLEEWCKMPDWQTHLEKNGGLTKHTSQEGFNHLEQEYFRLVKHRIKYCEWLIADHRDILVYYTLAQLYNRCDLNKSPDYLYKRQTHCYCLKVLELDPKHRDAKLLLKEINEWVESLGGDNKTMPHIEGKIINEDEEINFEW